MDHSGLCGRPKVAGLILCGGRSQRMGRDKASLPVGSDTFIVELARRIGAVCQPVVVVGQATQSGLAPTGTRFVADELDQAGPLAGIAAGLAALAEEAPFAQVAACDAPLFVSAITGLLLERIGSAIAALPWDGTHVHGLNGLYRTELAGQLRQFLRDGIRRVRDLPQLVKVELVPLEEIARVDPELNSLRGPNNPEEFEEFQRWLRER
jgi:molybdopterin-guanine dinucleotide biosynthesis protein A